MDDKSVFDRIGALVEEEHELLGKASRDELAEDGHGRLEDIRVSLDQCWDLLRQRRALRHRGQDPDLAAVRDADVVESYEQ